MFLVRRIIGPKASPIGALGRFQTGAKQVIEVAIRKSLDIEKYRCTLDLQFRIADDMYFPLADREGFQRIVRLLRFSREPFDATTRGTKRIGEVG